MNFPQQIKQHKNESDSFAIILYKLRELGIFRNVTTQDYGIDFEIELVEDGRVCGHCVKVQVKSSDDLHIGTDGRPSIRGIKQTTLRYWAELSYSIPVIALCVDLKTETVYMTEPLFWQAISLLDATNSTKTIYFNKTDTVDALVETISYIAKEYSLREELLAHKWIVRNIRVLFNMYDDSWWYDHGSQNVDKDLFKTFLENARILMMPYLAKSGKSATFEQLFSYDYYYKESDYDEPYNYVVYEGLSHLFRRLLKILDDYRTRVLGSGYFWIYNDDDYFKLIAETIIPTFEDEKALKDFNHDSFFRERKEPNWFSNMLAEIERKSKSRENELMDYLINKYGHYTIYQE